MVSPHIRDEKRARSSQLIALSRKAGRKLIIFIFLFLILFSYPLFLQEPSIFYKYWTHDNTRPPILTWSSMDNSTDVNTSSTLTISWETNLPTICRVDYGTSMDAMEHSIVEFSPERFHTVILTGLLPQTRYYYKITPLSGNYRYSDETFSFITPPIAQSRERIHFAIYGDTRDPSNGLQAVANAMYCIHKQDSYNFIVHVGDVVGEGGNRALWNQFFTRTRDINAHIPLVPAIGNHEFYGEDNPRYIDEDFPNENASYAEHYLKYFALPGNEKYYSLNFGNVHYIILDSNEPGKTFYRDTDPNKNAQAQWLYDDLLAYNSSFDWIFVSFHHPFDNSIRYNITTREGLRSMTISEIFHEGGVDGIFVGHYHTYERIWHEDKGSVIPYVITGGGGADLDRTCYWERNASTTIVSYNDRFEFMDFTIEGGNITVVTYDIHGNIIDTFKAINYEWEIPSSPNSIYKEGV